MNTVMILVTLLVFDMVIPVSIPKSTIIKSCDISMVPELLPDNGKSSRAHPFTVAWSPTLVQSWFLVTDALYVVLNSMFEESQTLSKYLQQNIKSIPILNNSPWKAQYFEPFTCPENTIVPVIDPQPYQLNPQHSWVYNKLVVAQKQSIPCGPHGTSIPSYPAFSKPIYNLNSMGAGIQIFLTEQHYRNHMQPGHMWVQLLTGDHFSTDVAVLHGKVKWMKHTRGIPLKQGTFDYWQFMPNQNLSQYLSTFIENHLEGYSGMMNLETIGGKIIEIHLRFTSQWPDLYGSWFVPSLIELYSKQTFPTGQDTQKGFSVVLFGEPKLYLKPQKTVINDILRTPGLTSTQLPFMQGKDPMLHSNPPGAFRMAIINGFDLKACKSVREILRGLINK